MGGKGRRDDDVDLFKKSSGISLSGDVGRIRHSFYRTFPTVRIFGMLVPTTTRSVEIVRVLLAVLFV